MEGEVLRDYQWERLREFVPGGRKGKRGPRSDGRLFLDALLWLARSGGRWRDLPEMFGPYQTAKRRYYRWVEQGVIDRIFAAVSDDPDIEWLAIDATVIRAQAQAAGARVKRGCSSPGSRAFAGRVRHQDPRRSRCPGLADPLRPRPRTAKRHGSRLRSDPRHPGHQGAGRSGLRCRPPARSHLRPRWLTGYSASPPSQISTQLRSHRLQTALGHRRLLRQTQAVATHRHTLRQTRQHHALAQMIRVR